MTLRIGFFCLCLCFAAPAYAEDYVPITWPDLLHTAIRFNALDLSTDNVLLDEYAMITDCDLYQYYFSDDFKWNQIRGVIRKSTELNKSTYPAQYHFDTKFKLDRYDFEAKLYRFDKKTSVHKVNSIVIYEFGGPVCGGLLARHVPMTYRAILNSEITIPGIAMESKDAEALMKYMDATSNEGHYIYGKFYMTVIYIEPFRKRPPEPGQPASELVYYQTAGDRAALHIDVHIDSVEFFKDREMLMPPVYTFRPPRT